MCGFVAAYDFSFNCVAENPCWLECLIKKKIEFLFENGFKIFGIFVIYNQGEGVKVTR